MKSLPLLLPTAKANVARVIFFVIIFSANIGKSQTLDWANPLEPQTSDASSGGYDVAIDKQKNVYMAGSMNGDCDADPGPGVTMLHISGIGQGPHDAFLCKYTPSGSLIWAFNIASTTNVAGNSSFLSVTCDDAGDVVVCGTMTTGRVVDFDPGPGTFIMSASIFIAKYDSSGNFIWAISPTTNPVASNMLPTRASIKTDKANNIYITGFFTDTTDFDPGPNTFIFATPYNTHDIFLAKYTSTGAFCWAKQFGNMGYDFGITLDLDDSANVYFAGTIHQDSDFDAGPGTNILTSTSPFTPFVAKYDSAGNHIWAFAIGPFGASSFAQIHDLELDHNGDIYVTGLLKGTCDFDHDLIDTANFSSALTGTRMEHNGYIAKYSPSGNYLWAFVLQDTSTVFSYIGLCLGIDANNDVIAGGYFRGPVDFDPGVGVATLTTGPGEGIYLAKYSPQGNYQSAFGLGDSAINRALGITTDNTGAFYVSGGHYGLVDFDPGAFVYNLNATSHGGSSQAYVAKYKSFTTNVNNIDNSISEFSVSPNPFSSETKISFNLFREEKTVPIAIGIEIYDIQGRIIKNIPAENLNRGVNKFVWDATNNSGYKIEKGIYFITVRGGVFNQTKKVVIM